MTITLAGEELELLPERAFYWAREKTLGLSDVHIGKAESLQTFGIPIPSGSHHQDLAVLSGLIDRTGAQRVFILGDWIHQKNSWTPEILGDLRQFFAKYPAVEWTLLLGNHERGSLEQLQKFPLQLVENEKVVGPFLMTHGHGESVANDLFRIQGHVHPVVRIQEGSTRLRLPCFVADKNSLTLPSFGVLTGGYEIQMKKHQRVFATIPGAVFEVPF